MDVIACVSCGTLYLKAALEFDINAYNLDTMACHCKSCGEFIYTNNPQGTMTQKVLKDPLKENQ